MALGAIFSRARSDSALAADGGSVRPVQGDPQGGIEFPYKASFWFLVATAFWNLFGAGVLGFLINLPFVSYFQHGSFLTAAHGHGALMGVYGMLAIALALFSLRNIVEPRTGRRSGSWSASGA